MEDNRTEVATIDMAAIRAQSGLDSKIAERLVGDGDLAFLTPEQKIAYLRVRCEIAGLDWRTNPFQFIRLQGKTVLYASKSATDQLSSNHKITTTIVEQRTENDIRLVTVHASTPDGRATDEIGAVPVGGLKGADLCNALMKAVTKAKRRAILSICGLGMMDESELDTVKQDAPLISAPKRKEKVVEPVSEPIPTGSPDPMPVVDAGNVVTTVVPPPEVDLDEVAMLDDTPPEPPALLITQAQVQRLYAAAHSNGWTKADARKLLAVFNYGSAKEIVQGEIYDCLYKAFEQSTPQQLESTIDYLSLWRDERASGR